MVGYAFFCQMCHKLKPAQEGAVLKFLQAVAEPSSGGMGMMFGGPAPKRLTNGMLAMTGSLIFCEACIPAGVESQPLADVGVRADESHDAAFDYVAHFDELFAKATEAEAAVATPRKTYATRRKVIPARHTEVRRKVE